MACVTYSDQGPHFHVSRQRGAGAWGGGPTWSMGDSGAGLHQLQYLRLDQIGQIIPRRDHLIEVRIL